jgi:hypothetical protein
MAIIVVFSMPLGAYSAPSARILQHAGYLDSSGIYHVVGEAVNDSNRQSTFTGVVGTFYDDEGNIITVGRDLTEPLNIPPGESAAFKITVHRDVTRQIDGYSLDAESNEFLDADI